MSSIILIAHNLRSCHNVGSLLRTAEGLGVAEVILTGHTPYPAAPGDSRMPHESAKIHRRIAKTSLGAEASQPWRHVQHLEDVLQDLRGRGYTLAAIEQAPNSFPLPKYNSPEKIALLVGREVEGVEPEVLVQMDIILEIPMRGKKESFNVAQAAAMALYHCAFVKSTTMIY